MHLSCSNLLSERLHGMSAPVTSGSRNWPPVGSPDWQRDLSLGSHIWQIWPLPLLDSVSILSWIVSVETTGLPSNLISLSGVLP